MRTMSTTAGYWERKRNGNLGAYLLVQAFGGSKLSQRQVNSLRRAR